MNKLRCPICNVRLTESFSVKHFANAPFWCSERKNKKMTCVKTGGQAFLTQYNQYVYCDIHKFGNVYIMRVAERDYEPYAPMVNLMVRTIGAIWPGNVDVIVCEQGGAFETIGEGIPVDLVGKSAIVEEGGPAGLIVGSGGTDKDSFFYLRFNRESIFEKTVIVKKSAVKTFV